MTVSSQADQVVRTTPIAILAVAEHMIDRKLPAPISISRPCIGEREVQVFVHSSDFSVWTRSIVVDTSEDTWGAVNGSGRVQRIHHGRLENGVRVAVSSVVMAPWILDSVDPVDEEELVEPLGPQARAIVTAHVTGGVL